jgi:hypothetical protein
MKKQIEIKDNLVEYLKVSAAWCKKSFKCFIEDLLEEEAQKSALFNQNMYEEEACKYLNPIKKEFKLLNAYHKKMTFQCYNEGLFTYEITIENVTHEIGVINDNMSFHRKMSMKEILEKTPFFLWHRAFYDGKCDELFTFRIGDTEEYKKRFGNGKDNK